MAHNVTVTWTEEETKILRWAVRDAWSEVAYDVLQAVADDKGKPVEKVTVPRSTCIEVALDAGRTEHRMRNYPDIIAKMQSTPYKKLIELVKPAFPFRTEGL